MHVGLHILIQREFNKDLYRSDTVKMHKVTKETKKNFGTRHKWIHDWLHIVHNEPLYIKGTSAEMSLARTIERDAKTFQIIIGKFLWELCVKLDYNKKRNLS